MRRLFLLALVIPFVFTDQTPYCTNNFTLVDNKCLKLFTNDSTYQGAEVTCSLFGGSLAVIKDDAENTALASFIANLVRRFWIGLYCVGNEAGSCVWDDQMVSANVYNNFAKGFPYIDIGNCVYYSTTGGTAKKWYSTNCTDDLMPFVCEVPTTFEDSCQYNYNGYCYIPSSNTTTLVILPYKQAQEFCAAQGANLASIHSSGELRFLRQLFSGWPFYDYSETIGGVQTGPNSFYWTDGTPWDYSNFVSDQPNGCLGFNYPGFFSTHNCEQPTSFLCKRPAGGRPAPSVAPVTVAPFPSDPCNTTLMVPATITSPNYPNTYGNHLTCTYSLVTVGVSRIRPNIVVFSSGSDVLFMYDGDSADSPSMGSLRGDVNPATLMSVSLTTGNRMFLVFKTNNTVPGLGFHIKFNAF